MPRPASISPSVSHRSATVPPVLSRPGRLKGQAGWDLVQIGVGVALVAVMTAGAFSGVPAILTNIRVNEEISDLQTATMNLQLHFSGDLAATPTNTAVIQAGLYPANRTSGVKDITNHFGGSVTVEDGAGKPKSIVITTDKYPPAACIKLVRAIGINYSKVKVNDADISRVKDGNGLDSSAIATNCKNAVDGSDGTSKIAFEFVR
jgi:hypothetical protein